MKDYNIEKDISLYNRYEFFPPLIIFLKAELLQLKPHPFIYMRNFINKKLEIEKTKPTFIISILKVEY